MTSYLQGERDGDSDHKTRSADDERLARCKRASLRSQAVRAAWQLGALVRRVEREAPQVHRRLRSAVEALQLLGAQLTLELEVEAAPERPPRRAVTSDPVVVRTPRAGEASGGEVF